MFQKVKQHFFKNPTLFYAASIAATWANVGSLLNGITTAQQDGIIPYLLWALGNTLACIVFGLLAPRIPKLRDVFRTRAMKILMGVMCPFQCWISMNGIQTVASQTPIGSIGGVIVAIAFAVFFIVLLAKNGIIRNILSNRMGWIIIYGLIFILTLVVLLSSNGNFVHLDLGADNALVGVKNCLLLIPGAFLYPYYYKLLDYNDEKNNKTKKISMRKAFVLGGLLFGIYLVFVFLVSLANFDWIANIIKAFLVTLLAISSLSSFQYSMYAIFGKKLGIAFNIFTVLFWQFLIPLGVMGAWTLMASVRVYIVVGAIIFAIIWDIKDKKHNKRKEKRHV